MPFCCPCPLLAMLQVCGVSRLVFEPPVIYCTGCGIKIKRGQVYYTTPSTNQSEIKGSWCEAVGIGGWLLRVWR